MDDLISRLRTQVDRTLAVVAAAAGVVAVFIGWWGVSGAALTAEQLPYLASGAVGGLFALGLGATLWLSADLRDEWRKLDDIHQAILDAEARAVEAEKAATNGTHLPAAEAVANGRRAARPRVARAAAGR